MYPHQQKSPTALLMTAGCFVIWGVLPGYLKLGSHLFPYEMLAWRIVYSFSFMVAIVFLSGKKADVLADVKELVRDPKRIVAVLAATVFVCSNWFTFIWAVSADRILDTSLGYYINPLLNILAGMVLYKERLSPAQWISVALALIGVVILTVRFGSLPWASLALALSMVLYSIAKKYVRVGPITGLTLETFIATPFALAFLAHLSGTLPEGLAAIFPDQFFLMGFGLITVLSFMFYTVGINKLPLTYVAVLQYIAPTLSFFIGVFYFKEPFDNIQLTAFVFIWLAVIIFSAAGLLKSRRRSTE